MTEITMAKMSQLTEAQKEEVRKIFVTSYYKDMKTLHRDTERLLGGFRRLLQEDLIRVAMDGDRPVDGRVKRDSDGIEALGHIQSSVVTRAMSARSGRSATQCSGSTRGAPGPP